MVGALSVVGLPAVDSHTSPFLCLDLAAPTSISFLRIAAGGGGDHVAACKSSRANGRKFPWWLGSLELGSSYAVSLWHNWRFEARAISGRSSRQQQKLCKGQGGLVITNELGGQYEDSFEEQILNCFTCKAARTVLNQLYEMNPPKYMWFYEFVASNDPGDGKRFIRILAKAVLDPFYLEKQDLAERVMVTRLHLYGKWIKKCDHAQIYKEISDENLELMRERLMETMIWPSDDTSSEKIG